MLLQAPEPKTKKLDDYDFTFTGGVFMSIPIDQEAGDTITFGPQFITVKMTAKPAPANPLQTLPAEDITFMVSHLLSIQHRVREVTAPTAEAQAEWQKTIQELSSTVN